MSEQFPYQYIVVHKCERQGVTACQVAHAAAESIRELPMHPHTYVAVLEAESSAQLEELAIELSFASIDHTVVREPDPPYNGAATAVGITPTFDRARIRAFVDQFPVLR